MPLDTDSAPPPGLWAFYWHFIRQSRGLYGALFVTGLGVALELMPREGQSLVLAAALISIAANAALFSAVEPLRRWVLARSAFARQLEMRDDPLAELPTSTDRQRTVLSVGLTLLDW